MHIMFLCIINIKMPDSEAFLKELHRKGLDEHSLRYNYHEQLLSYMETPVLKRTARCTIRSVCSSGRYRRASSTMALVSEHEIRAGWWSKKFVLTVLSNNCKLAAFMCSCILTHFGRHWLQQLSLQMHGQNFAVVVSLPTSVFCTWGWPIMPILWPQ